jgi:hypothetical protein
MTETPFHDPLVEATAENLPERFFDRFMFNMHPVDDLAPSIIVGYGVYPPRDVADGFAVVTTGTEQRNVRFSTELSAVGNDGAGPLRFACVTPNEEWRLTLGPNPTGLEMDVTWRARTPYWLGSVEVENTTGEATSFDHLVQSGRYSGTLTLDGAEHSVNGWYGQRDRSRGVRTMAGGQGLHIWFQAQFADRSVGFLLVENRSGGPLLLEGAVMHEDGRLDDVTNVRHALEFTDGNDLIGGRVVVTTASGAAYDIACDATAGGGWMAGGGYGGHHGKPRGRDHIEHDVYPLDGSVSPRTLDSALTDRNTVFTWDGQDGRGIFEFALSRSSSYSYVPTLSES